MCRFCSLFVCEFVANEFRFVGLEIFYLVDDLPNIFFTVSDVFASLFLFFDDVVFDNSEMLLLEEKSSLNDAYMFYRYFKKELLE